MVCLNSVHSNVSLEGTEPDEPCIIVSTGLREKKKSGWILSNYKEQAKLLTP